MADAQKRRYAAPKQRCVALTLARQTIRTEGAHFKTRPPTSKARGSQARDRRSVGVVGLVLALVAVMTVGVSEATSHPVGLGTAGSFAVLAGAGVTNTGPTIVNGDLGTCPTPAITGFPPGQVVGGTIHAADAVCRQAQGDLVVAYNDAAGRAPTRTFPGAVDFGGMTLTPGVYRADSCAITGPEPLVLDAQGDPDAVFIFQCGSTLITGPNSSVVLVNGAQACNVFWQVGSSATLGTNSTFVGTILALTSITANTGATVDGRLLARNGAVTLASNEITVPECAPDTTTTSSTSTSSTSTTSSTLPDTTTTSSTLPDTTTTSSTLPDTTTTSSTSTTSSTLPDTTTTSSTTTSLPDVTTTLPDVTTTTRPSTTTSTPSTTSTTSTTSTSTTLPSTGTTTPSTNTTVPKTTTTTEPSSATSSSTTSTVPSTTLATHGGRGGGGTSETTVGTGGRTSADTPKVSAKAETGETLPKTGSPARGQTVAGVLAIALGSVVLVLNGRRRGPEGS